MLTSNQIIKIGIVLFTVFIFSCSPENAPDLVLLNGKVWTGVDESTFEEAVAIKDNRIVAVGKTVDIQKLAGSETQSIDLNGKLVTAGFNDAHIHFLGGSMSMTEVEITGTRSPAGVAKKVNTYMEDNPASEWITGPWMVIQLF